MVLVKVRVLGAVEIAGSGSPRPRERTVLSVLAVYAGRPVPTSDLIDALWGESPPRSAVHTLQGYVARLRAMLGRGAVSTRTPGYQLDLPLDQVDVSVFERLVENGRRALKAVQPSTAASDLGEALHLWRGDPACQVASGSAAAAEVTRLCELHLEAEELWGEALLATGRDNAHVMDLERMARAEPLRERRWELAMVALHRAGRHADALRAYRHVRTVLGEELGIEPGDRLRRLEEAILLESPDVDRWFASSSSAGVSVPELELPAALRVGESFDFVDRNMERAVLVRTWREAAEGLQVVFIDGEAGVGKTRLVTDFARLVRDEGAIVLAGRCDEILGVHYRPFVEALQDFHVRADTGVVPASLPELLAMSSRRERPTDGSAAPDAAESAAEEYRLFEGVVKWLAERASNGPLLLILEDLQWATCPTLLLLRHLIRSRGRFPALIIATHRECAKGSGLETDALLMSMRGEEGVVDICLQGLEEEGVVALAQAVAGHELDESCRRLARDLHVRTGGNPFFVTEVVRHLISTGVLQFHDGRLVTEALSSDVGIPPGVTDAIRRRLARLSPDAAEALALLSIVGLESEAEVLDAATDVETGALVAALDEAVAAQLLDDVPSPRPTYRFRHALVQSVLYEDQSAARRALAHRSVASAIEEVHSATIDHYVAALAHHHLEAMRDNSDTAVSYSTRAAAEAMAQFAFADAVMWYRRAIEALDRDERRRAEFSRRCDLQIALGDAQRQAGEPGHRQTLLEAAARAQAMGDVERLVRAVAATYRGWASSAFAPDDGKVQLLENALTAIGEPHHHERAKVCMLLSSELAAGGADERVRALADEAIIEARRSGDPAELADALNVTWTARPLPDDHAARAAAAAEMRALVADVDDPRIVFSAHGRSVQVAAESGAIRDVERSVAECERVAVASKGLLRRALATSYRAMLCLLRGDVDEAELIGDDALQLGEAAGSVDAGVHHGAQRTLILAERDEFGTLAKGVSALLSVVPQFRILHATLAWALAESGHHGAAASELALAVEHIQSALGCPGTGLASGAAKAALAAAILEDHSSAAVLYDLMSPWEPYVLGVPTLAYDGPAARFLGLLATTLGDLDRAQQHLEQSEACCVAMDARSFLAHNDLDLARVYTRRGSTQDRDRAERHLRRALASAGKDGYRTVVRHAEAVAADLG